MNGVSRFVSTIHGSSLLVAFRPVLLLLLAAGCAAESGETAGARDRDAGVGNHRSSRRRVVHRRSGGVRARLRPLQRRHGALPLPGTRSPRCRFSSTTTTTAISTSNLVQGRMLDADLKPEDALMPRRDRARSRVGCTATTWRSSPTGHGGCGSPTRLPRAASRRTATGSASPRATWNNDGWTDLSLPTTPGTRCTSTAATARSRRRPPNGASAPRRGSASRPPSSTTTGTAGSISTSGHNVDYTLESGIECGTLADARDYCPPETYGGTPDHLYRNTGDGRFVDVSETALVGGRFGPASASHRRLRRRRVDRHLCRQRRHREPALDQPGRRHVPPTRACSPARR